MLTNITPAVRRALHAAQRWAAASELQPIHLLLGLLEEEEGRAAELLTRAGVDIAAARVKLGEGQAAAGPAPVDLPLQLSPVLRAVWDRAWTLAAELAADRALATEHLLLALLAEDSTVRRSLQALGLNFAQLEAAVLSAAGPPLRLEEPLQLADPTGQIDTARILDASANRAREALRVVEDYCRFVLDDAFLTAELKRLRHQLTETLHVLPANLLLQARDTLRDVGTAVSTPQEQHRASPQAVAQANLKRLQEALRSLEEFGKVYTADLGPALEHLRYRSYTLERAIIWGTAARQRLAAARLYVLVTGSLCHAALDWTIREAAAGGAHIFQLREKSLSDRELVERARQVRRWTREAGVLFILNDRPDLARLVEADGVHLGQDELAVKDARRIVGPDALIGVSTHNLDQVRQAVLDGASYLGVGPTFPSATKRFAEFAGLEFVRQVAAETSLPAFVIGGVTRDTLGAAVAAGARRIAVSQAICQADDPRAAAGELLALLPSTAG
jgi:thiamine-phosphate pyrophosphorylase